MNAVTSLHLFININEVQSVKPHNLSLNFLNNFHASGAERISRYRFAQKIAEKFSLPKNLIKPTRTKVLYDSGTWLAKRPPDSSLKTNRIQNQTTTKLLNVNEALEVMIS